MKKQTIAIGIIALGLLAVVPARADDRREVEGRSMFAKGEYEKALDLYADLFAEKNDPVYLRNIGRCYQKLKRPEKSIDAFREYLRRAHVRPAEREEINGFIKEMQDLQASQAGTSSPAPAASAPKPFEPAAPPPSSASAQVGAESPAPAQAPIVPPAPVAAKATSSADTTSAAGATLVSTGESHPDEGGATPITSRWWFWTGIGAVVVAGVVTAIVLSSGRSAVVPPCTASVCPGP
jgi:hypothetical protein